jgi:enterochelin esterase-like enzyme
MKSSRYLLDFIPKFTLRLCRSGFIFIALILAGCSSVDFQSLPPEAQFTNTAIILPTIIPSASPSPYQPELPTATATMPACVETQGAVMEENIPSAVLGQSIRTQIYLPPCYDPEYEDGYPSIIMLHGQNGVESQWIELGMTAKADMLISNKEIPPVLIIFPFEKDYLKDAYLSRYPDAIVQDLVPGISQLFNLKDGRKYHAIGGLSRGANWAVRIGLTDWQVFGRIGAHSFTTFQGDINLLPAWLEELPLDQVPEFSFDIGEKDIYFDYSDRFVRRLQSAGVPLIYEINAGGHNNNYWSSHVEEYLRWYTEDW